MPRWKLWAGRSKCLLFEKVHYLTGLAVHYDWLHCKYLGVDCVQFGSVLWLLVFELMPYKEPSSNLKLVWNFMVEFYSQHQVAARYASFSKLSMFQKKKGSPKLRGKGAQIKAFGPLLLDLWAQWMNDSCPWHHKIKTMLKLSCSLEKLLEEDSGEMALNSQRSELFIKFCFGMCQIHRDLTIHYQGFARHLFPDIPKMHPLCHIALGSGHLNPQRTSCWKGEDLMGLHRALARSSATRVKAPQKTQKIVEKVRFAMSFQLEKLSED